MKKNRKITLMIIKEKDGIEPSLKDEQSSENIPEQKKEDEKEQKTVNDRKSRIQARLAKSKAALKKKEEMKYRASANIKSKASLYEDKLPKKDGV